jgi:RNA polymerase sigma factor (sigma-70 family)
MSEDEIIAGVLSHGVAQRKALEALYRGVGRHMKASFMHWGVSADDAADILQETAIRIFRHAASYQGRGTARAWMWQIARNSFVDHVRVKRISTRESSREAELASEDLETELAVEGTAGMSENSSHMAPANEVTPSRTIVFVPVEKIDDERHHVEPDIPVGALDKCVQEGLKAFGAQYPERQLCLFLQMEGASVDEIAAQIGRNPGATREFLSQCRRKLEPFVSKCRELIPA